jgi:hypothetical protein
MLKKLIGIKKKDLYYEYKYMDAYSLDFSTEFVCRDCLFRAVRYSDIIDHVCKDCRIMTDYTLIEATPPPMVLKPNVHK